MKGLDTNVLVRLLVQDDPIQSPLANDFLTQHISVEQPAFINNIVLCELVWVLETAYKFTRQQIAKVLDKILQTSEFEFENAAVALAALNDYRTKGVDYSDSLIARINQQQGCRMTMTFDKNATKLKAFKLVE